ncbi:replication initiation protein [Providencia manganoxydans]|uniref:replication initiation protein n=1 Tax=Providencia manganoxydans TaxID=2923283 RepID=UPI0034E3AB12
MMKKEKAKGNIVSSANKNLENHNVSMGNQLVRGSHNLSLNEKRIIAACMSMIDSRNEIFNETYKVNIYRLYAKDFADLYELGIKNAYTQIKDGISSLVNRTGRLFDKSKNQIITFNWIDFSIKSNNSDGYIDVAFGAVVREYLFELKSEYTSYKLINTVCFKSVYTWRVWELLQSYKLKYNNKKLTSEMTPEHKAAFEKKMIHKYGLPNCWKVIDERNDEITRGRNLPNRYLVTLDDFRFQLSIPESYRWQDIKKQCIERAISEFKKSLNIEMTYKVYKSGRSVTAIDFQWKKFEQLDFIDDE